MNDENIKVEIKVCSYHWEEICGMKALYITDPPKKGEPICEMIKRTRIDDRIICHIKKEAFRFG